MKMEEERKNTILIVDDDEQVLKSLKIWLKNEGFKIETAADRDQALKIVEKKKIDVVLLDLRLIDDSGIDVIKRLNAFDKKLKIIILTGYPSFDTAVEAMKTGAYDYVSKGSPNEKILKIISNALAERKRENIKKYRMDTGGNKIRVVLFCDHSLIKERLENISEQSPVFRLVETFPGVNYLTMKSCTQEADICLVCASCHSIENFDEAAKIFFDIFRCFPRVKPIIINESFSNEEKVKLLKLGIKGFASRFLSSKKLEKGLLHVEKGGFLVDQGVVNLSLQNYPADDSHHLSKEKNITGLTCREIEILHAMTDGLTNKGIAERLTISEKTVKTHLNRIFKKLKVTSRAKAILASIEKKLL